MNFLRLLRRDMIWYAKPFICLSLAACLVCAVLTSALLIGESVRGTLSDNLEKGTSFVKSLLKFTSPVEADIPGGVLHASGFISSQIKADLYAFPHDTVIQKRDAYCSSALAEALKLNIGDTFTVRVLTIASISSEELMGMAPELKQIRLVYKGIWQDSRVNVSFTNPQLRSNNLFVNHDFLVQAIGLDKNVINEVWLSTDDNQAFAKLSDAVIWNLSQLKIDNWNKQPVLKCKSYFLPRNVVEACPNARKGLITFAESLTDSTGNQMDYFFVGAFDGNILPVNQNNVVVSSVIPKRFEKSVSLTCFVTDDYRQITRQVHTFAQVSTASDSAMSSALCPDIPGLTDVDDCTQWIAGVPIDLKRVQSEDKDYWEVHKSKPKVYLNFKQAQKIFAPGRCTLLIFEPGTSAEAIKNQIIPVLRNDPTLFQNIPVAKLIGSNIQEGVQFAPLFLGLSLFIIISGLLILWMLLKLHILDRSQERRIFNEYVSCENKVRFFMTLEIILAILPGLLLGLGVGVLLCLIQLSLLEHVWNGIIGMDKLNFHANSKSFLIAFSSTFLSSYLLLFVLLRISVRKPHYYLSKSHPLQSLRMLGTLSFLRRFKQYRLCIILLVLGIIGTLGVGAFGIKVRGEDGFSYEYVAQTAVPVVPSFDSPFPQGGLPVRVYQADSADCSNLLRALQPTVYGCDLEILSGRRDFLNVFTAAADTGSLQWIMKKKLGDTIDYPNGKLTLERAMKASVFQHGILVGNSTFETLFPNIQGAQFFLIRDKTSAEAYQTYLEPFGLTISTVDTFMANAEYIQNRYLTIFLQLGVLGFILGVGSLVLMILRNLNAQQNEIRFLRESGFTGESLFRLYYIENGWVYGLAAMISLIILGLLTLVFEINVPVILGGWVLLIVVGTTLIYVTVKLSFSRMT